MSKYIPNQKPQGYLTNRQYTRHKEQIMKKIEKKYGKDLPIPTEEDMAQYINEKTQQTEWQINQEEKQTN